jgi:hypothetical protein
MSSLGWFRPFALEHTKVCSAGQSGMSVAGLNVRLACDVHSA